MPNIENNIQGVFDLRKCEKVRREKSEGKERKGEEMRGE